MTNSEIMNVSTGNSAVMSHTLLKRIPVNYTPGAAIMYGARVLYSTAKTVRDNDMKVFLCILKAYTDNKFEAIEKAKNTDYTLSLDVGTPTNFTDFKINTKEISRLAYNGDTRTRAKRLLDSMERMAGVKIHLIDEKGRKQGFVQLVSGAILSADRKTMSVGINKDFLKDMSREIIQYNFPKMLGLQGINFRLYIALQQRKYHMGKGKYGYTNIDHEELKNILNIHNVNAKSKIQDAFKEIGINFMLHPNGKWHYPKVEKIAKNDEL